MKDDIVINFFHICDYASFAERGKLNILGIFENINPKTIPYTHPQMYVVCSIFLKKSGNFKETIKIIDENNTEISKLEFPVEIKIPDDKKKATLGVFTQFNNVKFEKFGNYKVQVLLGSDIVAEQDLRVLENPQ